MAIKDNLQADLKEAIKSRDTERRDAIRLLVTALKNAEIEKGGELTDDEASAVLQKQAKQRRDSIAEFERADRQDLIAKEQQELTVIEAYLPRQMDEEEIRQAAREQIAAAGATGPADIGRVMGPLMSRLRGRADGALVQRVVRSLLSN